MRTLSEKEIKDVLRNWETKIQGIRQKMMDLYHELEDTESILRSASLPSADITAQPGGKGTHKDLGDVLINYRRNLYKRNKEVRRLMWMLAEDEESILRVWHCFQILEEPYYSILYGLYVKGELYQSVELEYGWSHRKFENERKAGMRKLMEHYESNMSVSELVYRERRKDPQRKISKKKKDDETGCHQYTLAELAEGWGANEKKA